MSYRPVGIGTGKSKYDLKLAARLFEQGMKDAEVKKIIGCPDGTINSIRQTWRDSKRENATAPRKPQSLTPSEQATMASFWEEWGDACERRVAREEIERNRNREALKR